jgi:hypothetical protein
VQRPFPVPRMILRRFCTLAVAALVVLGGCRIERTPLSYIDHIESPAGERDASREELIDRLLSTATAAQRRDSPALVAALVPLPEAPIFGLQEVEDSSAITAISELVALSAEGPVSMAPPLVEVGADNDVAWFSATYHLSGAPEEAADVRFSGVFVRQEGAWRLAQAHLSRSATPPPPSQAPPEAQDTAAGGG